MIEAVVVMNTQGKPRLTKFYDYVPLEKQQDLIRSIYGGSSSISIVLCSRAENVSNFIKADSIFGPETRLVYKHYTTLYIVFVFDSSENELAMLDLIQVFVETLDKCFKNVCELDVLFNFSKIHTILNEIVFGGQVLETSSIEVMKAVEEITRLEKASCSQDLSPAGRSGSISKAGQRSKECVYSVLDTSKPGTEEKQLLYCGRFQSEVHLVLSNRCENRL